jgi:uncharacterized protein with NRDE domain
LYGISNALLDTPWPKVVAGKERLKALLATSPLDDAGLFRMLSDGRPLSLPAGIPANGDFIAGSQAPIFIRTAESGTRCSTLLWTDQAGGMTLRERSFDSGGSQCSEVHYRFDGS